LAIRDARLVVVKSKVNKSNLFESKKKERNTNQMLMLEFNRREVGEGESHQKSHQKGLSHSRSEAYRISNDNQPSSLSQFIQLNKKRSSLFRNNLFLFRLFLRRLCLVTLDE